MDQYLSATIQKRIEITVEALRKNRFEAHYLPTKEELLAEISKRLSAGGSCSLGGSMTLRETGVQALLEKGGNFTYFDRYAPGADIPKVYQQALSCDVYLSGTNAVTMDGKLYNVDGKANRVAAICYGPQKVIIVAGYNKIVSDVPAAQERLRHFCAPANALRLERKTPCAATGVCQDCSSPHRMCSQELITGWQQVEQRICVFILGEQYGF